MKIKIGFDDNGKMSKEEMLEWDKNRVQRIHGIAKSYQTDYTRSGKILYYLDANGKYDSVERLQELLVRMVVISPIPLCAKLATGIIAIAYK